MRSVEMALDAYKLENHSYPLSDSFEALPVKLTTPITYIQSLPTDPLKPQKIDTSFFNLAYILAFIIGLFVFSIPIYIFCRIAWKEKQYWDFFFFCKSFFALLMIFLLFLPLFIMLTKEVLTNIKNSKRNFPHSNYIYATNGEDFIIQSIGLDYTRNIPDLQVFLISNQENQKYKQEILLHTYDATNGTFSSGDVFRLSE